MDLLRFIIHSVTFRKIIFTTACLVAIILIANKLFDSIWGSTSIMAVVNLHDVYAIPTEYNNFSRVNLKLISSEFVCIEGNKKFKITDSNKDYNYLDTFKISRPDTEFSYTNKIFLNFENQTTYDSIYFVVSKSTEPNIYWNQIFYTSVQISSLNVLSSDTGKFRIKSENLVNERLLFDNDTLIQEVFLYFNVNKDKLGLAECGTNCKIFKRICDKFNVPCRIISLRGGNEENSGYNNIIGYPLHVVCEIYSSKTKKWFVVDPSYGSVYKREGGLMSAIEISNKVFFKLEKDIFQDSVLVTKNTTLGKDYFRYYENVYFESGFKTNEFLNIIIRYFFGGFDSNHTLYSNQLSLNRNGRLYLFIKSIVYFSLTIVYINIIILILSKRLLDAKWQKYSNNTSNQ